MHLTIHQSLPAGVLKGVPEHRILDWKERKHKDFIFGEVIGRSRLIGSVQDENGKLIPDLDLQTGVGQRENESREQISNFLKDFKDPATATFTHSAEADADPCYIHDFVKSVKGQWVAEQVRLYLYLFETHLAELNASRYGDWCTLIANNTWHVGLLLPNMGPMPKRRYTMNTVHKHIRHCCCLAKL